jgi:hypothetical protein
VSPSLLWSGPLNRRLYSAKPFLLVFSAAWWCHLVTTDPPKYTFAVYYPPFISKLSPKHECLSQYFATYKIYPDVPAPATIHHAWRPNIARLNIWRSLKPSPYFSFLLVRVLQGNQCIFFSFTSCAHQNRPIIALMSSQSDFVRSKQLAEKKNWYTCGVNEREKKFRPQISF